MKLTNEGAIVLLTAMLKSSASEIRKNVDRLFEAHTEKKRLQKMIDSCQSQYDLLTTTENEALRAISREYKFLLGHEKVKPMIDGNYVVKKIAKEKLDKFDKSEAEELEQIMTAAIRNIQEDTNDRD